MKQTKTPPSGIGCIDDPLRPILGMRGVMQGNEEVIPHTHPRAQLAYASAGVLRVNTADGTWVIPPTQAVWVPGDMEHQVIAVSAAEVHHLFIDSRQFDALPTQCSVLEVSPFLRELIIRAISHGRDYLPDSPAARLMAVIGDELQALRAFVSLPALGRGPARGAGDVDAAGQSGRQSWPGGVGSGCGCQRTYTGQAVSA